MEKQKLVYVMNRDGAAKLTISSPLEAHKTNTIMFDVCGVDNGFDNPIFACLEVDYSEADTDTTGAAVAETPKVCVGAKRALVKLGLIWYRGVPKCWNH